MGIIHKDAPLVTVTNDYSRNKNFFPTMSSHSFWAYSL